MTIKDFKVGEPAFIVNMNLDRKDAPSITETVVTAIGRVYVTTGNGMRRFMEDTREGREKSLKEKVSFGSADLLLEKCFNYLDNGRTGDGAGMERIFEAAKYNGQTKNIELKYFTVTFYKKGTCHIVFKDEELLKKFNIFGAQHRGWLPPSYGKKAYKEMTEEEQAVVDEFEGEIEYSKTMSNTDFYLTDTNAFLLDTAV